MRKNTPEQAEAKRQEVNQRVMEWRRMQKAAHICRQCGETDAYTLMGRTYCAQCAEKNAAAKQNERDRKPGTNAQNVRKCREKRRAEGRCDRCGKPKSDDGYVLCGRCRGITRKQARERRIENGVNFPRGANGYCWQCNKRMAATGYKLCEECLAAKRRVCADLNGRPRENQNHVWRQTWKRG